MTPKQIKEMLGGARFVSVEVNSAQDEASLRFEHWNSIYELKIAIDPDDGMLAFNIKQRR